MLKRLTAGLCFLAACHAPTRAAVTAGAPPAPAPLRIVTVDYAFDSVPDTVAAGNRIVELVNHGHQSHMIALEHIDSGHTMDEFVHAVQADSNVTWIADHGGPNLTLPGDSTKMEVALPAGVYAITCWVLDSAGKPHVMLGMMKALNVVATTAVDQPDPVTDDTVALTRYRFTLGHPLTAGAHVLRIENADSQAIDHDFVILHILPGHTVDDAMHWLDTMQGTPASFETAGSVSGIGPGQHVELFANLVSGNYAIVCLMPDNGDGKPHYRHGMVSPFTVE